MASNRTHTTLFNLGTLRLLVDLLSIFADLLVNQSIAVGSISLMFDCSA